MALYYNLPVYRDTYQLILKVFEYTKEFPKEFKYTLGQDMKRDAIALVRCIYRANKATHKKEYLDTFLDEFEILKLEIRLCADMKLLSFADSTLKGNFNHLAAFRHWSLSNLII